MKFIRIIRTGRLALRIALNAASVSLVFLGLSGLALAPHDPGVRGGPPGAGGPFPTLNATEMALFEAALLRFQEVDSVSGTISGESGVGLGPTFNANSCAMCHVFPAIGGTSPAINPQLANNFPHLDGAFNPVDLSGFLHVDGPVREVRFVKNQDGAPDGGVHGIFTIAGRSDASGCNLEQPDFPAEITAGNAVFRIPTPLFGMGLIENVSDATLRANLAGNQGLKYSLGIVGRFNTSGNDGTITRNGWKAQNKSLEIFAGEAYNVEQGVSNELFPNERSAVPGCVFNATPEDSTNLTVAGTPTSPASAFASDVVNFAAFMRLSAPPKPTTSTPSQFSGQVLFSRIGCSLCHSSSLKTAQSPFTGMSNVIVHPYSDFAIHHMGAGLADHISQGVATGDEFRTAPLWGIGQRFFFLHDGRTSDLLEAIQAHSGDGSEADRVITSFRKLSDAQQQDILNFLRSL